MSIHKSLVSKGRLKRHRNVLSRTERILRLEEEEKWAEGKNSIFALPKVRVAKLKRSHAKKKEAEEEEGVEGAAATATGTAPEEQPVAPPSADAKPKEKGKAKGKDKK